MNINLLYIWFQAGSFKNRCGLSLFCDRVMTSCLVPLDLQNAMQPLSH